MGGADSFENFLMGNMNVKEQFTPLSPHACIFISQSYVNGICISVPKIFSYKPTWEKTDCQY